MLTATMNACEVYHELMRDFNTIRTRGLVTGRIYQKEMLRKGLRSETRSMPCKTAWNNEWQILFQMEPHGIKTGFHVKTMDKVGVVAYTILFMNEGTPFEDPFIVKYNSHFFKRYKERMELPFTDPSKTVRHFFRNNFDFHMGESELLPDGTRYMHFIFNEGIAVGWQDTAKKTLHIKTFISNKTLTEKQRNLAEHIKRGDDEEFFHTVKPQNMRNKVE